MFAHAHRAHQQWYTDISFFTLIVRFGIKSARSDCCSGVKSCPLCCCNEVDDDDAGGDGSGGGGGDDELTGTR